MKKKPFTIVVAGVFIVAQLACNLPMLGGGGTATPGVSSPELTLTALFAVPTSNETATSTLPPVVTATSGDQNSGGGQSVTATTAPSNTPEVDVPVDTATPKPPTATSTQKPPAATATIPFARTNSVAVANFLKTPPKLDGDWSEWKTLTTEYPANTVVFGTRKDSADLSASFHVGWDNTYLYIAVKVHDNKYVQNATGANLYKGDSIEILLDTKLRDDYYYSKLSPDDFQLGLSAGHPDIGTKPEAYLWFPSSLTGSRTSKVKIAAVAETGGYRLEAAIPWSVFEVDPASGMHMGFALSVSDNDDTSKNVQQKMVSNDPNRNLADPTTWGDLKLTK